MDKQISLAPVFKLHIAGLVIGAVGILTLFATGVATQRFPVGAVLLLALAVWVARGNWPARTIISTLLPLLIFLLGAFVVPGLIQRLTTPSQIGAFAGTAIQQVGLLTAIVTGVMVTMHHSQGRR